MGKKKNASAAAAAAGASASKDINDLRTLNYDLVKEVAELRKQIEHLRSQLDSLTADRDISESIQRDVFSLALSSSLGEADARSKAQIAEATHKAESATAELNATEMRLHSLLRKQEEIERELEVIIEGSEATQYSQKAKPEKARKKNWIVYPIAVTAIFFISTAVVSLCKSSKLKK